jgi:hypothetical protein
MAVEVRAVMPGVTAEQMRPFLAQLGGKIKAFPGFVAHASGPVEGGYHVTEIWESQDAYERWVREVVMPAMQQMGGGRPPQPEYLSADTVVTR